MKKLIVTVTVFTGIVFLGANNSFELEQVAKERVEVLKSAHGETI